jgi:hypothetical protein
LHRSHKKKERGFHFIFPLLWCVRNEIQGRIRITSGLLEDGRRALSSPFVSPSSLRLFGSFAHWQRPGIL